MNRAFKNPIIFFYQVPLNGLLRYIVVCVFCSAMSPSAYRTWITNESISLFKYYTVDMQAMHKRWIYYYDLIFKNKLYERHTSTHCFCWTPYNAWTSNTALTSTKNDIFREVKLIHVFMATWRSVYNARATFILYFREVIRRCIFDWTCKYLLAGTLP